MTDIDRLIAKGVLDYAKNLIETKETKMTMEEVLRALADGHEGSFGVFK